MARDRARYGLAAQAYTTGDVVLARDALGSHDKMTRELAAAALGYDPATTALVARMTTPPSAARKLAINKLVRTLRSGGVWAKLDALYILAAADSQAALLNWKSTSFNLTAVNSPTFTANIGYVGDGSTSKLTTGFTPSTAGGNFTQNDAGFGVLTQAGTSTGARVDMGAQGGTGNTFSGTSGSSNLVAFNDNGAGVTVNAAGKAGLWSYTRTAAASFNEYAGEAFLDTVVNTSAGLPTGQFCILSSTSASFSQRRACAAWIGGGLSAGQVRTLNRAIDTYMAQTSAYVSSSIVGHGNSLTAGSGAVPGVSDWPTLVQALKAGRGSTSVVFNVGTPGWTTQQLTTELTVGRALAPLHFPAKTRLDVVWEIRNDIAVNALTATQAVNNLQTYCNAVRALGSIRILVCNTIADGSGDASFTPAVRAEVNAQLAIRWPTFADGLIDLYADPRLQNPNDTTYYDAGKLHLNAAGYAVVAGIIDTATLAYD